MCSVDDTRQVWITRALYEADWPREAFWKIISMSLSGRIAMRVHDRAFQNRKNFRILEVQTESYPLTENPEEVSL